MSDDDTYEIPLQDQRIFGAGIKRKRVKFVPSTTPSSTSTPPPGQSTKSVGDLYLSLVLPKDPSPEGTSKDVNNPGENLALKPAEGVLPQQLGICEVCKLPVDNEEANPKSKSPEDLDSIASKNRPHEASLAHQVCLSHSHPPSHLDRNRKGLGYLSAYGWDPDARVGLGAAGQGIQFPIKMKEKNDKLGIGVVVPKDKDLEKLRKAKEVKLDAGKVRKMAEKDRRKAERLREMFYRSEDVERYLGGG